MGGVVQILRFIMKLVAISALCACLGSSMVALVAAGATSKLPAWHQLASDMVDKEIVAAGVKNERVIRAMRDTPRHEFIAANQRERAYLDMALPIGNGQTISPPFVV